MDKNRCKFLAIVLSVMILIGIFPITASAAEVSIVPNDSNGIEDPEIYNFLLKYIDEDGDGRLSIKECDKARALDIENCSSLKGLNSYCPNIYSIEIYGGSISDLDGIEGLNLQRLIINNTEVSDLTPIANMNNMKLLNCSKNQISKLPNMKNWDNLTVDLNTYGLTTDFTENKLTYDELYNNIPDRLINLKDGLWFNVMVITQTPDITDPPETQPTETVPNTDPSETQPTETVPNTDPSETQPTETAPNTDPPETQPTETVSNTDPPETQPTETVPNTDPSETQPATGETLPQPTADPSVNPTGTLPETPSGTENESDTNPVEDETQDTTAAPTTDKSDNDNNGSTGDSNVNNNNVGGSGGGNSSTSSGNSTGTSNTQGKSAGTVNTGDSGNWFAIILISSTIIATTMVIKRRKSRKIR